MIWEKGVVKCVIQSRLSDLAVFYNYNILNFLYILEWKKNIFTFVFDFKSLVFLQLEEHSSYLYK